MSYSKLPFCGHCMPPSSQYKGHHWVLYFTRVRLDSVLLEPAISFQWAKIQPRGLALGISLLSPDPVIFLSCCMSTQISSYTLLQSFTNLFLLFSKSLGLHVIFHKNTLKFPVQSPLHPVPHTEHKHCLLLKEQHHGSPQDPHLTNIHTRCRPCLHKQMVSLLFL